MENLTFQEISNLKKQSINLPDFVNFNSKFALFAMSHTCTISEIHEIDDIFFSTSVIFFE